VRIDASVASPTSSSQPKLSSPRVAPPPTPLSTSHGARHSWSDATHPVCAPATSPPADKLAARRRRRAQRRSPTGRYRVVEPFGPPPQLPLPPYFRDDGGA
jgi:hypothetical protein